MRLQTRAYILAHGGNPDAMSEDDFELVMVAFNDGLIGNKTLLTTFGSLTTGIFNYIRSNGAKAYELKEILGIAYDYIYKPLTEEEKEEEKNQRLLNFIHMMPGATNKFNKNGN